MEIKFKNNKVKKEFLDNFSDAQNIYEIIAEMNYQNFTLGYFHFIEDGEILLVGVNSDFVYIDEFGDPTSATGKFKKYQDINSSPTDLENDIKECLDLIMNDKLDVIIKGRYNPKEIEQYK